MMTDGVGGVATCFAEMSNIGFECFWLSLLKNIALWDRTKNSLGKFTVPALFLDTTKNLTLRLQFRFVVNYVCLYQFRTVGINVELPDIEPKSIALDQKSLSKYGIGRFCQLDKVPSQWIPYWKFLAKYDWSAFLQMMIPLLSLGKDLVCIIGARPPFLNHGGAVCCSQTGFVWYDANKRTEPQRYKDLKDVFIQLQRTLGKEVILGREDTYVPLAIRAFPMDMTKTETINVLQKTDQTFKGLIQQNADYMLDDPRISSLIIAENMQSYFLNIFGLYPAPESQQTVASRQALADALVAVLGNSIGCGLHVLAQLAPQFIIPVIEIICQLPHQKGQEALLQAATYIDDSEFSGLEMIACEKKDVAIPAFNLTIQKICELPHLKGQQALLGLLTKTYSSSDVYAEEILSHLAKWLPKCIPVLFRELYKLEVLGVDVATELASAVVKEMKQDRHNARTIILNALCGIQGEQPPLLSLFIRPDKPEDLALTIKKFIPIIFQCENLTGQKALFQILFASDPNALRFPELAIYMGEWLKPVMVELDKSNGSELACYLTKALVTQDREGWNGLHDLALYAPECLETVTTIVRRQGDVGRKSLLTASQQRNNEGESGAQYVARYAPKCSLLPT